MSADAKDIRVEQVGAQPAGQLKLVGGPQPYLWLGSPDGICAGTVEGKELRRLRDLLTAALRPRTSKPRKGKRNARP